MLEKHLASASPDLLGEMVASLANAMMSAQADQHGQGREDARVVGVHALIATGVNADGHREIRCLEVASAEDSAGCLAFWRGLGRPRAVRGAAGHR